MDAAHLELRRRHVCSTDAGPILGFSRFSSALDVWTEKVGLGEPRPESVRMRAGLHLEAAIASWYSEESGRPFARPASPFVTRDGLGYPAGASPDGFTEVDGARGVAELKSTTLPVETIDDVPLDWLAQVGHQLLVLDLEVATLIVFSMASGPELRWFDVERRPRFEAHLREKEAEFWTHVEEQRPPAADGSESSLRALRRMYPAELPGSVVKLTGDLALITDALESAKEDRKEAEAREAKAKATLIEALGAAERGLLPDGRVLTYKTTKGSTYEVTREATRVLRIAQPKIARLRGRR